MKFMFGKPALGSFLLASSLTAMPFHSDAAGSSYGPPSSNQMPQLRSPRPEQHEKEAIPLPPLPHKPVVPPMTKPFGMPGVVGVVNGKWEGTDYLGYLTDKVGIDVEVLKGPDVPQLTDTSSLKRKVEDIFSKYHLIPHAEDVEGPPLPFLHLLVIVYPVDQDRYVIFGNARLFEEVKVVRKEFVPQGFWQAITWENQDVTLSTGAQLNEKIAQTAEKLGEAFVKRYRQYNLEPGAIPTGIAPAPAQ